MSVASLSSDKGGTRRVSFDSRIFPKAVMSTFEEATKKTKFNLHHLKEVTYDLMPDENDFSYFKENPEGQRIPLPEHINEIGTLECLAINNLENKNSKPIYDVPIDDRDARIERVKVFEDSFKASSSNHDDFDAFEPVLREEESILCTLNCSEIAGFPSTTHNVVVKGLIKCAIVRHETDGLRLLFSIAEGSKTIKVDEKFFEAQTVSSCICCCVSVTMSNGSNLNNTISSGMDMAYAAGSYFGTQFSTMPVSPTIVDSVCYRLSVNEREAHTADSGAGSSGKPEGCCKACDCNFDCKCPCECTMPVCCGFSNASGAKTIHFHAEEVVRVLPDEPDNEPIVDQKTISKSGVQWKVNAQREDDVYVTVHYRSLMDNRNHSCHMRLVKTKEPTKDYDNAKVFVSILGHQRNKDLKDQLYWNIHPPMDFQPIRAPSLYNRYNSAHGVEGVSNSVIAGGIFATCATIALACVDMGKIVENMQPCFEFLNNATDNVCFKTCCPCVGWIKSCRRPF